MNSLLLFITAVASSLKPQVIFRSMGFDQKICGEIRFLQWLKFAIAFFVF